MQKFTHPPFADKTCEVCHQPAKDGKVVLTQSDSKALCVTCHSEQAEKIEKAKVQHPGAQGDCIACHNPHAGKTPGFIQPDPVNACLACHSEQADQLRKHICINRRLGKAALSAMSRMAATMPTCCGRRIRTHSAWNATAASRNRRSLSPST